MGQERLAAAPLDRQHGKLTPCGTTYGWLLSGLARAVTGKGMRELFREESRSPAEHRWYSSRPATGRLATRRHRHCPKPRSPPTARFHRTKGCRADVLGLLGAVYFPGILSRLLQDDMPFLDGEVPAVNGVVAARALAKTCRALANDGVIERRPTAGIVAQASTALTGKSELAGP